MQPKQVYYLKCKVDQECQLVGICTKQAPEPDTTFWLAARNAETFGWGISAEGFVEGDCCMRDNFIVDESDSDSDGHGDDYDSDEEETPDLVVWETGTIVMLKAILNRAP